MLELSETAYWRLKEANSQNPMRIVYLGGAEHAHVGNGIFVVARRVVEIDDDLTGEQIFYVDTQRHWPRVFLLLTGFVANVILWSIALDLYKCTEKFAYGMENGEEGTKSSQEPALTGSGMGVEDQNQE